ncbi:MAG: hypothetical protein HOG12_17720, partial [Alphaproteobacteria bacterium]|nr:hypothetical protein [Alphaproteobacteria bacterium]
RGDLTGMYIVAADSVVDGAGDLSSTDAARKQLKDKNYRVAEYEISSSTDGWQTDLPPHRLRCACAPLVAFNQARQRMAEGEIDAVVIQGREHMKSDFQGRKDERNRLMKIYGEGKCGILDGYEKLAQAFITHRDISADDFRRTSEYIFENHWRVWQTQNPNAPRPADAWFNPVTPLFRGVDCANPSVDYDGCLVIVSDEVLQKTDFGLKSYSQIAACDVQQLCPDGPEFVKEIVSYDHMATSFNIACAEANVDFKSVFRNNQALLDIYSCYSVVPMGFLMATGFVENFAGIPAFAEEFPLTITGGLNLAKAPWNNTTVQTLASMFHALKSDQAPDIGGVHSIGALGYLQGFTILREVPAYQ